MSLEPQAIPPIEADPNDTDEQVFNQWANQRFALYQQMEQQIQAGIAQTLQANHRSDKERRERERQ